MIRLARRSDQQSLELLLAQYLQFYQVTRPAVELSDFVAARLRARPVRIWVDAPTPRAGAPLDAFVQVYTSWSTLRLAPTWILNDLYVAEHARGRGVGRALVEVVLREAERAGARTVELMTAISNDTARALYESLGFRTDDSFLTYSIEVASAPPRRTAATERTDASDTGAA